MKGGPGSFEVGPQEIIVYVVSAVILYWLVKGEIKGVFTDTAAFVSNPENPINKTSENIYQAITGSDESVGADFYDLHHNADGSIKGGALAHPDIWLLDKILL